MVTNHYNDNNYERSADQVGPNFTTVKALSVRLGERTNGTELLSASLNQPNFILKKLRSAITLYSTRADAYLAMIGVMTFLFPGCEGVVLGFL